MQHRQVVDRLASLLLAGTMLAPAGGVAVHATQSSSGRLQYRMDKISLQKTWERDGYVYEFFINGAYTCAAEGHHTFLITHRKEVPASQAAPLWIRMHGGVSGAYDNKGHWGSHFDRGRCESKPDPDLKPGEMPKPCFRFGESPDYLAYWLQENGLVAKAKLAGFRFLVPSGCDHDFFSGVGTPDPNNPNNPDENRGQRLVDGLPALRAAIDYTVSRMSTSHTIVHGTSSGSMGAVNLLTSLGSEDKRLSGAILDSSVISPFLPQLADRGCLRHGRNEVEAYAGRVGFYWQEENMGHRAIADGRIRTPVYDLWSRNDGVCDCPGSARITVLDGDGSAITDTGCNIQHGLFDQAIERYNPGGASRVHKVCVNDPRRRRDASVRCDLHSPSQHDYTETGGDIDRGGEDYNRVIFDWVLDRLKGPGPKP